MTTPIDPRQGAIDVAERLTEAVNGLGTQLRKVNEDSEERDAQLAERAEHLTRYGHINRRIALWAIIFTVIGIVTTAVAGVAVGVAIHASNRAAVAEASALVSRRVAASQHTQLIAGCRASNDLKIKQKTVWTFIESVLGPKPADPPAKRAAEEQFLDALKQHVGAAYASRNCIRAFPAPAPVATKPAGKPVP